MTSFGEKTTRVKRILCQRAQMIIILRTFTSAGWARLMIGEDGHPIWKATEKLVREVEPELGSLQPCPAPNNPSFPQSEIRVPSGKI